MTEEEKILNYSTEVFIKNGFYKTTMDSIASNLSISKKTIYKFFPSKLLLLEKVVEVFQTKIKNDLEKIVESDDCLIVKLRKLGTYLANFSLKVNKKFLNDFLIHQPKLWEKIETLRTTVIEDVWNRVITDGKKEGLIIDQSTKMIVQIINSAIAGVINPKFLFENNIPLDTAYEEMFTIIVNGILTEKGKQEFEKQKWK